MLKKSTGNMYEFITHTWNPIVGKCYHNCSYCYVSKYGNEISNMQRLNSECLDDDFGEGKFIFVGSGVDLFAEDVKDGWIRMVLDKCNQDNHSLFGSKNKFLFQSKNPKRILDYIDHPVFKDAVVCTTIETNRYYPEIMCNTPTMEDRARAMNEIASRGIETYLTIEPIMQFDKDELVRLIRLCKPVQVNIGANTNGRVSLPEPSTEDILSLIKDIESKCKVEIKSNMKRINGIL